MAMVTGWIWLITCAGCLLAAVLMVTGVDADLFGVALTFAVLSFPGALVTLVFGLRPPMDPQALRLFCAGLLLGVAGFLLLGSSLASPRAWGYSLTVLALACILCSAVLLAGGRTPRRAGVP